MNGRGGFGRKSLGETCLEVIPKPISGRAKLLLGHVLAGFQLGVSLALPVLKLVLDETRLPDTNDRVAAKDIVTI